VARHAEDSLGGAGIAQVLDLSLAVAAAETVGTEGLVAGQDGEVLDLVATVIAAVGAIVANERAIAEQQQVGVRVEQGAARVAAEAVNVPSVPGCEGSVCAGGGLAAGATYQAQRPCPPQVSLHTPCTDRRHRPGPAATRGRCRASP
jgi:hypothetical protein